MSELLDLNSYAQIRKLAVLAVSSFASSIDEFTTFEFRVLAVSNPSSIDTTILQKSSQDVSNELAAADKSVSSFIDIVTKEEEASKSIEDSSRLDVPAADQTQFFMDVGKELHLPKPEHKIAQAEKENSTLFTKQTSISVKERMSKTTFVPKMPKKLKPDNIHDMKENLLSPKWCEISIDFEKHQIIP